MNNPETVAGLNRLLHASQGDERIHVAVLDGVTDLDHPTLEGARLTQPGKHQHTQSEDHGLQIASIIFGRRKSPVRGLAPRCRGRHRR
ncbi:MAG: hypothetical protein HQL53_13885 [Magnetococcales bacterium]|nr:hypothetical protein [Magnetococcales bacterium]